MLADGRLRQPNVIDQIAHAVLASREVLQDRQPGGLPERLEQVRINRGCLFVQPRRLDIDHRHVTMMTLICDEF
ncbi:hypothetical protein GCM10009746_21870 [Microbacterium paludicola]